MKYYIQLHDVLFSESSRRFYSYVYGPFQTESDVQGDVDRRWPNNKETRVLVFEGQILSVRPSGLEKPEKDKRAPGNESNWQKELDGRWSYKDCQSTILVVRVAHPVHDGPFPLSGSGECRYEEVGYCPNCDVKPSFYGAPVTG